NTLKISFSLASLLLLLSFTTLIQAQTTVTEEIRINSDALIAKAMESDTAWKRLTYLADTFGPRFSGSENLENSIDWIVETM
ncbi:MAG: peptidase M28 family protein, partial [Aliifodinibius sp.]|nr:peptidase M28 family protein [Fodinibius sp.]NIV16544.1 peptidase M28 family protein [Fodinibius sp.]NIY30505.1 peptidase M28 family protein [Fodinibius sp.]